MRISSAAILLLAACSPGASEQTAAAEAGDDNLIECAVSGETGFARACLVEQTEVDGETILVVRHPDGGFRRFAVTGDGTGVATADGVQRAEVSLHDGGIEVAVGTDRYLFPATIAGDDAR